MECYAFLVMWFVSTGEKLHMGGAAGEIAVGAGGRKVSRALEFTCEDMVDMLITLELS